MSTPDVNNEIKTVSRKDNYNTNNADDTVTIPVAQRHDSRSEIKPSSSSPLPIENTQLKFSVTRPAEASKDEEKNVLPKNETEKLDDVSPPTDENKDKDEFPSFSEMRAAKIFLILLSLGLASFLYALEQTIVTTSIASIGTALNADSSLTWISTSYLLTSTVFQPITGRLADAVGARRLLIVVLWIFILGNLIAGLSKTLIQLIIGRLITGIGAAGMLSLCIIIISQLTTERQRAPYLNLVNFVFMIADTLGPIIGGAFSQSGYWRWIFLLNLPFGPVITLILLKVLHLPQPSFSLSSSSTPPSTRITSLLSSLKSALSSLDILGMLTLVSSLSFLIVGLNSGGQVASWDSPLVISMFVAFAVMLGGFVWAEGKAERPIAPGRLFVRWRWRNVPIMMVERCLLFFHLFATTFYLPLFLQVLGLSEINSGALVIPFLSTAALSSTFTGFLTSRYGRVIKFWFAGLIILPVGLGLMSTLDETSSVGKIVGYSIVAGLGFGAGTLNSTVIGQIGVSEDELPTVTALNSTCASLGGVLGVAVIGTIINNTFRTTLLSSLPSYASQNLNDIVKLVRSAAGEDEPTREIIVRSFVRAWKVGYWVLIGVAGVQLLMSLALRDVEMDKGESEDGEEGDGDRDEEV